MKTINDIRLGLTEFRDDVHRGQLFQRLGIELGQFVADIKLAPATPVELPDDNAGIRDLLAELNESMQAGELEDITDEQLVTLLEHLASPDLQIRDRGIFFFFNDALQRKIFTSEQLRLAFNYLIQDRILFNHILENENDGVYGRSFAVMILSLLLYADRIGYKFLDPVMVERLVSQMTVYVAAEQDTRGWIGTHGWAHAFTHIGNILDELNENDLLPRSDKIFFMSLLFARYKHLQTPLVAGETERVASYFIDLMDKNELYGNYFLIELKELRRETVMAPAPLDEGAWNKIFNRNRLTQAFLLRDDLPEEIEDFLRSTRDYMG